jgi:hypothetical protein
LTNDHRVGPAASVRRRVSELWYDLLCKDRKTTSDLVRGALSSSEPCPFPRPAKHKPSRTRLEPSGQSPRSTEGYSGSGTATAVTIQALEQGTATTRSAQNERVVMGHERGWARALCNQNKERPVGLSRDGWSSTALGRPAPFFHGITRYPGASLESELWASKVPRRTPYVAAESESLDRSSGCSSHQPRAARRRPSWTPGRGS